MKTILASLLCVGAFTLVSSCGGSSGSSTSACGGNIQGSWNITSSNIKVDVTMVDPDCPAATGAGTGVTVTGTGMYNADMTYTEVSTFAGTLTVTLPGTCLKAGATCADLGGALMGDTFQTATCAAAGAGCSCMLTFAPSPSTESGTYTTTAAGLLSQIPTGETTADESDYCVNGTTLTISPHAGSASGISGSIVRTKM
jgi:hypothetical protein